MPHVEWQSIVALTLVAASVVYVGRAIYKTVRGKASSSCGSCGSCSANNAPTVTTIAVVRRDPAAHE